MSDFAIKVRGPLSYRFAFLTPQGGLSNLRVHATRYRSEALAKKVAKQLREAHPTFEIKVVKFRGAPEGL